MFEMIYVLKKIVLILVVTSILDPALWLKENAQFMQAAAPGDNVTLSCDICSNPVALLSWSFNGDILPQNANSGGAYLTITDISESSYGNYTCTATNTILRQEY